MRKAVQSGDGDAGVKGDAEDRDEGAPEAAERPRPKSNRQRKARRNGDMCAITRFLTFSFFTYNIM